MSYDRAITVFSPDGHLFQVEYALEAVKRGSVALGITGEDCIILAIEKKTLPHLQDPRTVRKIVKLDDHLTITFSGLAADSRSLIDRARLHCQSHRFSYEEPISVEQCARYVAHIQQEFTQKGGRRPFGLSTIIAGFDKNNIPRLFITEPSGTYSEWKAAAIGRSQQSVTKFLESLYFQDPPLKENQRDDLPQISMVSPIEEQKKFQAIVDPVQLASRVLAELVEREEQSIEIVKLTPGGKSEIISETIIKQHIAEWKSEKEEQAKFGKSYESIVVDTENV